MNPLPITDLMVYFSTLLAVVLFGMVILLGSGDPDDWDQWL